VTNAPAAPATAPVTEVPATNPPVNAVAPDLPPLFDEMAPTTDPFSTPALATPAAPIDVPTTVPLPASTAPTAPAEIDPTVPLLPGAPQPGAQPYDPAGTTGN
jgi:hypothetical protein